MKTIIDGKRYDTNTATRLASWQSGRAWRDFRWVQEELYKTKNGAYFLAGEGGALTEWGTQVERNCRQGGSGIRPLTKEEAVKWLELHEEVDVLEAECPSIIQDA